MSFRCFFGFHKFTESTRYGDPMWVQVKADNCPKCPECDCMITIKQIRLDELDSTCTRCGKELCSAVVHCLEEKTVPKKDRFVMRPSKDQSDD